MTNSELLALSKAAQEAFLRDDPKVGEHMQRFRDAMHPEKAVEVLERLVALEAGADALIKVHARWNVGEATEEEYLDAINAITPRPPAQGDGT